MTPNHINNNVCCSNNNGCIECVDATDRLLHCRMHYGAEGFKGLGNSGISGQIYTDIPSTMVPRGLRGWMMVIPAIRNHLNYSLHS